jgi:hypothetical protein
MFWMRNLISQGLAASALFYFAVARLCYCAADEGRPADEPAPAQQPSTTGRTWGSTPLCCRVAMSAVVTPLGWSKTSDLSLREMPLFVGRCLPRRRRERRRELQSPVSKGQPSHAALTQSGC